MPITITTNQFKFKDPSTGQYRAISAVADESLEDRLAEISAAGAEAIADVTSTKNAALQAVEAKEASAVANVADAAEVQDMVAEVFDVTKNYNAGDYAIYETSGVSKLYRFTADHAAGAWVGTDATAVVIGQDVSELKSALDYAIYTGKNKAEFYKYGYILDGGTYTETSGTYYASTKPVHVNNGQTVSISVRHGTPFVRIRIAKASDNTRIVYSSSMANSGETRDYTVYTADQDCVVVVSYIASSGQPQIEFANSPTSYEPFEVILNPDIKIQALEDVQEDIEELQAGKANVNISKNIYKKAESGYVSIQNTLADAETDGYQTSEWIEIANGEKIIVSGHSNFVRVYVGANKLPTTAGGSRKKYITDFTDTTEDDRKYVAYTADGDYFVRVSFISSDTMPMVEKTTESTPSTYEPARDTLDSNIRIPLAEEADGLSNSGLQNFHPSKWYGKKALVIGDSITAAGVWQTKLSTLLGMTVTTHAKGGITFEKMLDGDNIDFPALSTDDVADKDLIIVLGGFNHRGMADGDTGDVYPTNSTTYGYLQYLINGIYDLMETADNLKARVCIITPYCAGAYSYIPYNWDQEYPVGSGRTGETLVNAIIKCARDNRIDCLDLFHTSGIGKFTWNVFSASSTPTTGDTVNDQLHLNSAVGYPYLGTIIAHWVDAQ